MTNKQPAMVNVADLLDTTEVAAIVGLSRRGAVSVYRARYSDFPAPIIAKNSGKCDLWLRAHVEAWVKARRR